MDRNQTMLDLWRRWIRDGLGSPEAMVRYEMATRHGVNHVELARLLERAVADGDMELMRRGYRLTLKGSISRDPS